MKHYAIPSRMRGEFEIAERNLVSFQGLEYPQVVMLVDGEYELAGPVTEWLIDYPSVRVQINCDLDVAEPLVFMDFPCQASANAFIVAWG